MVLLEMVLTECFQEFEIDGYKPILMHGHYS